MKAKKPNIKTLLNQIKDAVYINQQCPHCRRYDNVRIFFMLVTLALGIYYVYELRDDLQSQCCIQYIKLVNDTNNMNKWIPEIHKLNEGMTYKETAEGDGMSSLRGYLKEIGTPEVYYCVQYGGFLHFEFNDDQLNCQNSNGNNMLIFHRGAYRWSIIDDKELYITEKNNPTAQTYVFIPMAPAKFSEGGVQ